MSRSRNTEKESVRADYCIERAEDGSVWLPRIIVRRPALGDIHPLPRAVLAGALRREVPVEYIYGLDRFELRAREGNRIGRPFAKYWEDEKAIILYSLPMQWVVDSMPVGHRKKLEVWGAEVLQNGSKWQVNWPFRAALGIWYFTEVLTHELGHHFAEQYKKKRGKIRSHKFNELNANLHSFRLTRKFFERFSKGRTERKANELQ
jgi:hypothetical protein